MELCGRIFLGTLIPVRTQALEFLLWIVQRSIHNKNIIEHRIKMIAYQGSFFQLFISTYICKCRINGKMKDEAEAFIKMIVNKMSTVIDGTDDTLDP